MLAGLAFTTQFRLCISRSNLVDNLDLKVYYAEVSTKYFADQLCHSPTSSRSRVVKMNEQKHRLIMCHFFQDDLPTPIVALLE